MSVSASTRECPDDATVAALVAGELTKGRRRAVIDHAAVCSECRELLSELIVSGSDEPQKPTFTRYELLRTLGAGGMGIVYEAYDRELERGVALKVLRDGVPREGAGRSLMDEARAMAKLTHPNVVRVLDVGEHEGRVFLTMDLALDGTLRDYLAERKRSFAEIAKVFLDAGRGLAAAHVAGLVHRDFKPENVLLRDGVALVTDFGLARVVHGMPPRAAMGSRSAGAGTLHYMAPEQLRRERADARADVFAFCVTLWEALYGERPFAGTTPGALLEAIAAGPPRPRSRADVPRSVRDTIVEGLAFSPDARPGSLDALLDALSASAPRRSRALPLVLVTVVAAGVALVMKLGSPIETAGAAEPAAFAAQPVPSADVVMPISPATSAEPAVSERVAPPSLPAPPARVTASAPRSVVSSALSATAKPAAPARGPGGVFVSPPY